VPETYVYHGEPHQISGILDETVTPGLLVIRQGAIMHEEYRMGVTIRDALTMSSGVAFDKAYDSPISDVNRLIFTLAVGIPMTETLAGLERVRVPGAYNDHISSDSIALGLVLEAATGMPAQSYLETRLWGPMRTRSGAPGGPGLFCRFAV